MSQEVIIHELPNSRLASLLKERSRGKVLVITGHHAAIDLDGVAHDLLRVPEGLPTDRLIQGILPANTLYETMVAIGGGRILDTAKVVLKNMEQRPFFIAVPTTAGSGSEATPFAVIYVNGEKQSLEDPQMLPDLVLLETVNITQLPPLQRAISGFDALAQAIESWWNVRATADSRIYAESAIKLMVHDLVSFIKKKDTARDKKILWAAYVAGRAIAHTRTTGCHALSYYLTAHHGIPHGHAVAIFLPMFFEYNAGSDLSGLYALLDVKDHHEAAAKISGMMKEAGLAVNFQELGISPDMDALIQSVNAQRFSNNPQPFDAVRIKELIQEYLY